MQVQASVKSIRIAPRKMRLIADVIRNSDVDKALRTLVLLEKRGAKPMEKLLKSALANAVNNAKLQKETLTIKAIEVNEGTAMKRYHPSTRGRIHPYKKRTSHVRIVLEDRQKEGRGAKS